MARQIFKSILLGILIGALFFLMPFFILKFLLIFLLIGAICRLWWGGGRRRGWRYYNYHAYTDKIRNMSEEEYAAYKQKWQGYNCGGDNTCGGYYNYGCWEGWEKKTDQKKDSTNDQKS